MLAFARKRSKFNVDSKTGIKSKENVFSFEDNSVSIGSDKFSVLLPKYWYLLVNVLTSNPKILDQTDNVFY